MANLIRCKACGYIMEEGKLKDVCPACGLPKTVFEPYVKKISPQRKMLIDQHLHPIILHFPQVILVLSLFMPLLSLLIADPLRSEVLIIAKWSLLTLPFAVFGGFITGIIDGKLRFKKLTPPLLKTKIIIGSILQVLSVLVFSIYWANGLTGNMVWLICILNAVSLALAIYLGKIGSSMFNALLPG